MKRNRIKYHLDGSAVSVHQALKNYTADVALKWISMETSQLIQNESAYKTHMISFNDAHGYMKKRISYIKGWDLHTLSYQIILNCNDFRGISLDNEDDLVMLLSTIDSYNQRKEKDILNAISDNNLKGILLYVLGLAGEQFNYQVLPKHIDSFAREMFILIDIGIDGVDKTIDDISIGKFGCSWELLLKCLIAACAISLVSPIINIGCELFQACFDIPYNTFLSVLESYTSTYETIRQSADDYGRQILMGKPYVYTQKRELISINVYLNLFLI